MSGGGKGPSRQGSITQSVVNPTQAAQLPYLTGGVGEASGNPNVGWNQAYNLATGNPFQYFPGQTMAGFNPAMSQGYGNLISTGQSIDESLRPAANSMFFNAANGGMGVQNSPAYASLLAMMNGTAAPEQALSKVSNGDYLNSNPYLDQTFNNASDAVTRAYQTGTAPQTDSNYSAAGRYGSGAMMNARSQNEQDLGKTLGGLSSSIYGGNYQAERGRMDAASQMLAALMGGAGSTLQSGFQAGNTAQNQAMALAPSIFGLQTAGSDAMIKGGQGLTGMDQAGIDDMMKRFYGEQKAPWDTNAAYLTQIGQPTAGSSQTTSPLLGPSALSSALSTGVGLNSLFGGGSSGGSSGGLGSMFGGKGAAAPGAGLFEGIPGGINEAALMGGGGKGMSEMLPFLAL